ADSSNANEAKLPANIRKLLAVKREKRNKNQVNQIRAYFVSANTEAKRLQQSLEELQKEHDALAPPATPVMSESPERRATAILDRGDFLSPTEKVEPRTPETLPPMDDGAPATRVGLARWIVDPAN